MHAAVLLWGARILSSLPSIARPPNPALKVRIAEVLAVPEATPVPQPRLSMPEDTPRKAAIPALPRILPPSPPRPARPALPEMSRRAGAPADVRLLAGVAARKAGEQVARELFYPPEAIERGQEGEALVLLFLDEAGNAIAARIEASSGFALLDAAAVRAARTLKGLPASAPREALLPVRFRLR